MNTQVPNTRREALQESIFSGGISPTSKCPAQQHCGRAGSWSEICKEPFPKGRHTG